eukprot:359602-Chlamydomonas_euryale.AAC.12
MRDEQRCRQIWDLCTRRGAGMRNVHFGADATFLEPCGGEQAAHAAAVGRGCSHHAHRHFRFLGEPRDWRADAHCVSLSRRDLRVDIVPREEIKQEGEGMTVPAAPGAMPTQGQPPNMLMRAPNSFFPSYQGAAGGPGMPGMSGGGKSRAAGNFKQNAACMHACMHLRMRKGNGR